MPLRQMFAFAVAFVFATMTIATAEDDVEGLVRMRLDPVVGPAESIRACTVGVVFQGQSHTFGFGSLDPDSNRVADGQTLYEIGSVTKLFTGLLLADMVLRGEVAASDSLADLLPAGTVMPETDGKPITLELLATHRSGLPRLSPNFRDLGGKTPENPYRSFTREILYASLTDVSGNIRPDSRHEYSNFGYALLGGVLAGRTGESYETLVSQRFLKPLGMSDTVFEPGESQLSRWAPPHGADGKPCDNWNLAAYNPAGGLLSTASDMNRFATAALGEGETSDEKERKRLNAVFELAMKPIAEVHSGHKIGFGWFYHPEEKFWWHNGQTAGYFSILVIDRENRLAVTILSNRGESAPERVALSIRKALLESIHRESAHDTP